MFNKKTTRTMIVFLSCVACTLSVWMNMPLVVSSFFAAIPISIVLFTNFMLNGYSQSLSTYKKYIREKVTSVPEANTCKQIVLNQIDVFEGLMKSIEDSFFLNYSRDVSSGFSYMQNLCMKKLKGSVKRITVYLSTISAKGFATQDEIAEINLYIEFNTRLIDEVAKLSNSIAFLGEVDMALEQISYFTSSIEELGGDLNV